MPSRRCVPKQPQLELCSRWRQCLPIIGRASNILQPRGWRHSDNFCKKRTFGLRPRTSWKTKLIRMPASHPFPTIQVFQPQSQLRQSHPALAHIFACAVGVTGFAGLVGLSVLAEEHRTDVSALPISKSKGSQPNAGNTVINCDGNYLGVSKFDRVQPRGSRTRSYR